MRRPAKCSAAHTAARGNWRFEAETGPGESLAMVHRQMKTTSLSDRLVLFIAEGFGTGRIPFAPGTFGTLLGFGRLWLLISPGNLFLYLGGMVAGFFLAVWTGGRAEKILGVKDPGRI